ncbi:MAG TPA: hypothetical protein VME47_10310 [Acetobacteraceae bacterium]|nr:hypothetical protein [Acetobacteraceae bacterium]
MLRFYISKPLWMLLAVSACSPYVYSQEINGFSNGVDAVVASYQIGLRAMDAIAIRQRDAKFAADRTRLILLPGCDQIAATGTPPKLPDCAIVTFGVSSAPPPNAVQKALAGAAPAFDALKSYAAALTAVTLANDETALNQATQSLTTAANGLTTAVTKIAPQAVSAKGFMSPAGGLLGQGIEFYLDRRRLAVLRNTVQAVDPAVDNLGQVVSTALLDIWKQQLLQLGPTMRDDAELLETPSVTSLGSADYLAKLSALEVEVDAYTQARAADPTATARAMEAAHHQLAQALMSSNGQDGAILATVQAFVASAGQLKAAFEVASASGGPSKAPPETAK